MKIAITGATGFVGQHLVKTLAAEGHELLCISRHAQSLAVLKDKHKITTLCSDITSVNQSFYEYVASSADVFFHLAWEDLGNYKSLVHLENHLPNHIQFLKSLVEHGISKLVVAGTCFEYGQCEGALKESLPTIPETAYGAAKDHLRQYLHFLSQQKQFSLLWLRYFYMYGQGQSPKSFFGQLESAISNEEPCFNMSGGEQLRDYLSVEEAAYYSARLCVSNCSEGIYNICSGKPVSMRRLAEEKIKAHHSPLQLNLGYYPYPDYEPMAFWGDRSKLDNFLQESTA